MERHVWTLTDTRWRLPVIVIFRNETDIAAVQIPEPEEVALIKKMKKLIAERLQSNCMNSQNGEWYFMRADLLKIAKPYEGLDIEDTIEWRPAMGTLVNRGSTRNKPIEQVLETDDFLKPLVASGFFKTIEGSEMQWNIFMSRVMDRLINDQKPVHLGFCRIYAVPYRVNWKQILLQWDRCKFWKNGRKSPDAIASMQERKVAHSMIEERLTAWNVENFGIEWTLEIVPTTQWHKLVRDAEEAKRVSRKTKGPEINHGYIAGIVDTMKRLLPYSQDVYRDYLERISRPILILDQTVDHETDFRNHLGKRIKRFVPKTKRDKGKTAAPIKLSGEPISLGPTVSATESIQGVSQCPDSGLRAVFCFPPSGADVRADRREVEEPENRK